MATTLRGFRLLAGDAFRPPRRVRVEMARVYREMEAGTRDSQEGSRLVYVLTAICKALELTEIERRLDWLETVADRGQLPAPPMNRGDAP